MLLDFVDEVMLVTGYFWLVAEDRFKPNVLVKIGFVEYVVWRVSTFDTIKLEVRFIVLLREVVADLDVDVEAFVTFELCV